MGVLVTAFAAEGTVDTALGAGMRQVVDKPVDFGRLLPLIQEVVGQP